MTIPEFLTRWAALDWPALHTATMRTTLDAAVIGAQAAAPVAAEHGGTLRDSLHGDLEANGSAGYLRSDVAYAAFQNDGTAPHLILPRTGAVLVFPVGGHLVFARAVQHPGTRAIHFAETGLLAGQRAIEAEWPAVAGAWLRRLA